MARPTPVLPLVGSTIVPPGSSWPSRSAARIISNAGRSFADPPGLVDSFFIANTHPMSSSSLSRLSRISGVSPIVSITESTISVPASRGSAWTSGPASVMGPTVPGRRRSRHRGTTSSQDAIDETLAESGLPWLESGGEELGVVLAEERDQRTGRGVDEPALADHHGGDGLVAVGVLANDGGVAGIIPDVVLGPFDTELVELALQHRAEPAARPPVEIDPDSFGGVG